MYVKAAGRTLSNKNDLAIRQATMNLLEVLLGAGAAGAKEEIEKVRQLLFPTQVQEKTEAKPETQPDSDPPSDKSWIDGNAVEAGRLSDNVKMASWFDGVRRSLSMFRDNFLSLHQTADAQIERAYGTGSTRNSVATELIDDLNALLQEYRDNYPETGDGAAFYYPPMDSAYGMYAQAKEENKQEPVIAAQATSDLYIPDKLEFLFEFDCVAQEILAARRPNANQIPFEGVLFKIDSASESAPSKGSPWPLYVPMAVAELAAEQLNKSSGLPLDVDDSLSCHSDENIVGIMNSAEIRGNDFVVKGHLFSRNQGKKTALIASNKDDLGMSMNAFATGRKAEVEGKKVYRIDTLELLGANILLADRATWQQTRVLAAEIAASTANDNTTQPEEGGSEDDMELKLLGEHMEKMNGILAELQASRSTEQDLVNKRFENIEKQFQQQSELMAGQQEILSLIVAERQEVAAAAKAQQEEEQKKADTSSLIEAMSAVMDTKLKDFQKQYLDRMNPRRAPASITAAGAYAGMQPLVAQGAPSDEKDSPGAMHPLQLELLQCEAKLSGLTEAGATGPNRLKLIERRKELHGMGVTLPQLPQSYAPQLAGV